MSTFDPLDPEPDRFLAPLEDAHSPTTFASIVFKGWGVKLTGISWVIITFVLGYIAGPYVGWAAAIIGGVYVYVVCYQAWKSERQRSDTKELQLTEARQKLAKAVISDDLLKAAQTTIQTQELDIKYYKKRLEPQLEVDPDSVKCVLTAYPYRNRYTQDTR